MVGRKWLEMIKCETLIDTNCTAGKENLLLSYKHRYFCSSWTKMLLHLMEAAKFSTNNMLND